MAAVFSISSGWQVGIPTGLVAGIAFGGMMAKFTSTQRKRFAADRPDLPGETILHDGPANHFMGLEGVGGWLYLTPQRLFFRSHAINLQPHETTLPLKEIASAQASRTLGIIPNGLRVVTASGAVERFVVEGQRQWSVAITEAKGRNA